MKNGQPRFGLHEELRLIVRYTRNWMHYGVITFTVFCSLVAALRGAVTP